MKRSPVRLALPLLSGALLLTACPGTPSVPIDVPSSPAVLNGTWKGTLGSSIDVRDAAWGDGRVYLLEHETAPTTEHALMPVFFDHPKVSPALVVLDAATGLELQRLPVAGSYPSALRFRPAEPGEPARLVMLRSALVAPGATAVITLVELDPATLEAKKETTLPRGLVDAGLSRDGRWLIQNGREPVETRTLQPAPLPQAVREELALPQGTTPRLVRWDFGEQFLSVSAPPAGSPYSSWATQYFSVTTGRTVDGAAQHPLACRNYSWNVLTMAAGMAHLPDGGTALAYLDGTVELRDANDRLRTTVDLGDCLGHTLRVDGDVLTFAVINQGHLQLGTLRVTGGEVLSRHRADVLAPAGYPTLDAEGTALLPRPRWWGMGPLVTLERTSGPGWRLEGNTHTLQLDIRATWTSKTEYRSVGAAWLDGERLNFAATAMSGSAEFRAQANPPVPPSWRGTLRREDGTLVARVGGIHGDRVAEQKVMLELQGLERDFAFNGLLRP